ncbi:uncharacterized protein LOC121760631 [Salvia splendens]|uniref:uncharacterized protein LOC121760631 n=1 Tax=Salvia splendens TaxID=180675 RepID=UPI001C2673B2|nr:uncharacterized protein LOC121760631 [Salvia splendens]
MKFDKEDEVNYRIRLTASVNVTRLLLKQGLAFRENDESLESENRGNFLEILDWLREKKLEVAAVTLENTPLSNQMGEYNGLKSLILNENPSAKYVHCFAHQLQLVVVNVTKAHGVVLDLLTQEMENRFPEVNTELLTCMNCLSPKNSFASFNVDKLVRLAELHLDDFSSIECMSLPYQLKTYTINDLVDKVEISSIEDLGNLAKILVCTARDKAFLLVYCLIELTLILPVATASVERVFSSMKLTKKDLP